MAKFEEGNPGGPGRPKGSINGSAFAKEWAEERGGWQRLERIAMGREPGFRPAVQAQVVMYLIDRGYGRPSQESKMEFRVYESFAEKLRRARERRLNLNGNP